mgnify:CR=1 FL=1
MKKNVNVQTSTETQTTITTVTTTETTVTTETSKRTPAFYMPINKKADFGAEEFYKAAGVAIRTMEKFGKKRVYAIIPIEDYEDASDDEKLKKEEQADAFTQSIDNYRCTAARKIGRVTEHEKVSLNRIMDAGYDPTLDKIDIAIKINHTLEQNDQDAEDGIVANSDKETTPASDRTTTPLDEEMDDYDYAGKTSVSRGRYDSLSDLNNPEYIVAKTMIYSKLHSIIDELDGEDLEIVTAIMEGVSERKLAKKLGVAPTTLQRHREKLMARLRDILGYDCIF